MASEPVPQRDEQAVRRFVERFAAGLVEAGMPAMPARVFSALLATRQSFRIKGLNFQKFVKSA